MASYNSVDIKSRALLAFSLASFTVLIIENGLFVSNPILNNSHSYNVQYVQNVQCNAPSRINYWLLLLAYIFCYFFSTQVSLEPPPCEEFTIKLPLFNATRVSPPFSTNSLSFPRIVNVLKSTCRCSKDSVSSIYVG
mgnify:CR=1 FL=1